MKKVIFLLMIATVFFIVGCTSKEYKLNMDLALEALEDKRYEDALSSFDKAIQEKETKEVKQSIKATERMAKSISLYKKGEFEEAVSKSQLILDTKSEAAALKTLKPQAKSLIAKAKKSEKELQKLKEDLESGKKLLRNGQHEEAYELLKKVAKNKVKHGKGKKMVEAANQLLMDEIEYENQKESIVPVEKKEEIVQKQPEKPKDPVTSVQEKPITQKDAENLVRKHLNLLDSEIKVRFDHMNEKGDYIIHVYEYVIDDPATQQGHTATWGWYGVNPKTKEIYDAFK
ncbi:tetratricopeptide (TPR) repeat protein [Oikeobacillus pervagus]|uniref:Tetratricopeptide (TPR) repeat protein n=1 Tax=Oikeobacillus pervagus TaxID=1325931 RepID=A0AAJ1T1X0_9BACI|nr:hypothetical protein [Oikeobacillus pervagus]MDQ0215287.1 tetratricopeptide (TPR) repeat protein [Oikeobacillus pervagus]